jgi:hypothetical protein
MCYKFYDAYNVGLDHAVVQLVEALHYEPEGQGFDFQ